MKTFLKWTGIVLLGLIIVLLVAGFVVTNKGASAKAEIHTVTATLLSDVPTDSATIARGAHLAKIHACADCHAENFSGQIFIDAPPFVTGASNLTSGKGGVGGSFSVEDWDRAIRYGVRPDGSALMFMPSRTLHNLNDEDAAAMISYFQQLTPVDNEVPKTELRTIGKVLAGTGALDVASEVHLASERKPVDEAAGQVAQGKYLASITCGYCHGESMRGGEPLEPGKPAPPDLVAAGAWPFDVFVKAMRTGETPSNPEMDPTVMPWRAYSHMTDTELKSIQAYLSTLAS
ncbi:MAG: c-type cytochrome [Bacteroidota bacterium]